MDVKFVEKFPRFVPLSLLKTLKETTLKGMTLLHRGQLSVQPVSKEHFDFIVSLGHEPNDE